MPLSLFLLPRFKFSLDHPIPLALNHIALSSDYRPALQTLFDRKIQGTSRTAHSSILNNNLIQNSRNHVYFTRKRVIVIFDLRDLEHGPRLEIGILIGLRYK